MNRTAKRVINFHSLLLSCFKPHGGAESLQVENDEQEVVYIDISRESATDSLTGTLLRPGTTGCPRFVILSGDQHSYKMIVEIWLESWRERGNSNRCANTSTGSQTPLHEWLVPFPGFFHAEKQALYSLCKELLHGIGLQELAQCSGLSNTQIRKVLTHSHARDNRAFLFSLTCALVIHSIDIACQESPEVESALRRFRSFVPTDKAVVTEAGAPVSNIEANDEGSTLSHKTVSVVSKEVLSIGKKVRKALQADLCDGLSGRHFIGTILFGALLPTVGSHVLSRTGHTDVTEAFWFRLTYILHGSNHLKY